MHDLLKKSATEMLAKMVNKAISAQELMQLHIDRIHEIQPKINAVEQMHAEQALEQAKQADQQRVRGAKLGTLHGLPISIKDSMYVKDFKIRRGSKFFNDKVASQDATIVKRLKAAGAIVLAVTNVPEFLMRYETDNLIYGRTNNPYDLTRTPGGSSGGEAALIAAGGSPLGIGSDFGGSIRQPAHNCGITGIKCTQGLLPMTGNFPFDSAGLMLDCAVNGPMARYVRDLILTLPLLVGPDGYDPFTPPVQLGDPTQVDIKQLKIGYFIDNGLHDVDDDTNNVMQNVIRELTGTVNSVTYQQAELLKNISRLHFETTLFGDEHGKGFLAMIKDMPLEDRSPFLREGIEVMQKYDISATELRNRLAEATPFRFNFMREYHDYDILITPVAISAAAKHGTTGLLEFTHVQLFNLTGWPAVVVRCGSSKEGLPLGIQIAAKPWHDHIALAMAQHLENIFGGWQAPNLC